MIQKKLQHSFSDVTTKLIPNKFDKIKSLIDWSKIEIILESLYSKNSGRPAYPPVMMFRCLLLAQLHNLSDYELEYQMQNRIDFRKFAGFSLECSIPDHSSYSRFRDRMIRANLSKSLFDAIVRQLDDLGYTAKSGSIVDATIVETHKNDKEGGTTVRKNKVIHGYKAHVSSDVKSSIVRNYCVSSANAHDSQFLEKVIVGDEGEVLADKAYDSKRIRQKLRSLGIRPKIMRKKKPGRALSAYLSSCNQSISPVRAGIEKIFGSIKRWYGGRIFPYVGLKKFELLWSLKLSIYNLRRATNIGNPRFYKVC